MSQIPVIPNANAPLAVAHGAVENKPVRLDCTISVTWQRAFASLFANAIQPGMLVVFVGTAAPLGWVQDATVGLPALPGGMIWVRKI